MTQGTSTGAPRERTLPITILAIFSVIAGILSFMDAARYMGWLSIAQLGEIKFYLPDNLWLPAIMAAIVGVIWFLVAWWLWNLNPSGWLFVVVIAVINLVFLGLAILGKTTFSSVAVQVLINVVALVLALLPNTRETFTPTL